MHSSALADRLLRWAEAVGIAAGALPPRDQLREVFEEEDARGPCRPGADPQQVAAWEHRHGFRLPRGLRAWLLLSDGLYRGGPLIHPLMAIGPMIPFAQVPDLIVQPESWFELGNPGAETVCMDLAYTWPGGDCPIFASGDDTQGRPSRIIAPSFEAWLVRLLQEGGREYWLDPGFVALGDPWAEHRRWAPAPPLPDRLRPLAPRVRPLMRPGADDRLIASTLGISRSDVEVLFRHLQHTPADCTGP
ncbi:MAG: SMI1/KNR4 family protein [Isosphaeraceae bacterium]|nr:SMI1/KNR4 family protein [Isosphaeraceae bacterium]